MTTKAGRMPAVLGVLLLMLGVLASPWSLADMQTRVSAFEYDPVCQPASDRDHSRLVGLPEFVGVCGVCWRTDIVVEQRG